jgi:hypothetical protein
MYLSSLPVGESGLMQRLDTFPKIQQRHTYCAVFESFLKLFVISVCEAVLGTLSTNQLLLCCSAIFWGSFVGHTFIEVSFCLLVGLY